MAEQFDPRDLGAGYAAMLLVSSFIAELINAQLVPKSLARDAADRALLQLEEVSGGSAAPWLPQAREWLDSAVRDFS